MRLADGGERVDIAEDIMLHFARRGEACLGIHDSFVVRAALVGELEAVMRWAYRARGGGRPHRHAAAPPVG